MILLDTVPGEGDVVDPSNVGNYNSAGARVVSCHDYPAIPQNAVDPDGALVISDDVPRGFRRGGMPPALAPRMPRIFEDAHVIYY